MLLVVGSIIGWRVYSSSFFWFMMPSNSSFSKYLKCSLGTLMIYLTSLSSCLSLSTWPCICLLMISLTLSSSCSICFSLLNSTSKRPLSYVAASYKLCCVCSIFCRVSLFLASNSLILYVSVSTCCLRTEFSPPYLRLRSFSR